MESAPGRPELEAARDLLLPLRRRQQRLGARRRTAPRGRSCRAASDRADACGGDGRPWRLREMRPAQRAAGDGCLPGFCPAVERSGAAARRPCARGRTTCTSRTRPTRGLGGSGGTLGAPHQVAGRRQYNRPSFRPDEPSVARWCPGLTGPVDLARQQGTASRCRPRVTRTAGPASAQPQRHRAPPGRRCRRRAACGPRRSPTTSSEPAARAPPSTAGPAQPGARGPTASSWRSSGRPSSADRGRPAQVAGLLAVPAADQLLPPDQPRAGGQLHRGRGHGGRSRAAATSGSGSQSSRPPAATRRRDRGRATARDRPAEDDRWPRPCAHAARAPGPTSTSTRRSSPPSGPAAPPTRCTSTAPAAGGPVRRGSSGASPRSSASRVPPRPSASATIAGQRPAPRSALAQPGCPDPVGHRGRRRGPRTSDRNTVGRSPRRAAASRSITRQVGADQRGEVGLVDDQQVGAWSRRGRPCAAPCRRRPRRPRRSAGRPGPG